MPKEGVTAPDPAIDPSDVELAHELYGFEGVGSLGDTPAPDGWRGAMLDRFGLASSVLVHLFLVLLAIGWLASADSAEKPAEDEAIQVELVPAEAAKPSPPSPPEDVVKPSPPSPSENAARKSSPSAPQKPPGEAMAPPPSPPTAAEWSDLLASLGMEAYSRPTTLSQGELDAVRAQAKRCWKIPAGWTEPRQVSVTVRFQLNVDGTLNGSPTVVAFPASELGKDAALNAIRAVAECGPFKLPADKYDEWNDIQLRFEP
jgi:hypothetical protein